MRQSLQEGAVKSCVCVRLFPLFSVKSRKKRRINSERRSLEDWTDLSNRTASRPYAASLTEGLQSWDCSIVASFLSCSLSWTFLPSFLPPLLCCLLLAIRLFHYPAGDGGRKIEKKKERKKERNRIKIADEIKKREHASLTRSAINRRISFCFDFHVDFLIVAKGWKGNYLWILILELKIIRFRSRIRSLELKRGYSLKI